MAAQPHVEAAVAAPAASVQAGRAVSIVNVADGSRGSGERNSLAGMAEAAAATTGGARRARGQQQQHATPAAKRPRQAESVSAIPLSAGQLPLCGPGCWVHRSHALRVPGLSALAGCPGSAAHVTAICCLPLVQHPACCAWLASQGRASCTGGTTAQVGCYPAAVLPQGLDRCRALDSIAVRDSLHTWALAACLLPAGRRSSLQPFHLPALPHLQAAS